MTTQPTPSTGTAVQNLTWVLELASTDATLRLAQAFTTLAGPKLCILLNGPVGAGKSFFARSAIQTLMAQNGAIEDVPSPTFTIVQTYDLPQLEVWHADLYRLTSPDELLELGLEQALEESMCLIEWPDRLGDLQPSDAITLTLTPDQTDHDRRTAEITGPETLVTRLQSALENLDE